MITLGLEDLAANAFIEAIKRDGDINRFLTYYEIESYGHAVLIALDEAGENGWLDLGREKTAYVLDRFSDYFEETIIRGYTGLLLKKGITVRDLERKFRGYLCLAALLALESESAVKSLAKYR